MCKAIVGAGMMGLPRAFRTLGSALGTSLIIIVGFLTYWSMAVMVAGNERHRGATTYRALALAACGPAVALLVQLAVLLFCFGFCVVYLVVITDVLTGTPPDCNGLICQLTGVDGGPLVARRVVLAALAWFVAAPLLLMRSIKKLDVFNYGGVAAALMLALIAASLGCAAVSKGVSHPLPLLPQWDELGSGVAGVAEVAGILAVLLACYVGHQNLHPLLPLLRPYTGARMRGVLALALAVAALVFSVLCIFSALAFGPELQVNVLGNLSISAMRPLLGEAPAVAASLLVQVGYIVSLMASLLLYMHPLRTSLAELIWRDQATEEDRVRGGGGDGGGPDVAVQCSSGCGDAALLPGGDEEGGGEGLEASGASTGPSKAAVMETRHYYALTYGLLLAATLAAISVPNIWAALSVIGNMCASVEAFIVPGCIALALRGFWPTSGSCAPASSPATEADTEGVESFPLLLPGAVTSDAPAAASRSQQQQQQQQQRAHRHPAARGAGSGWSRLVMFGDVGLAVVAVALGCALLVNGLVQQLL